MSGTTSASTVAVKRCSPPGCRVERSSESGKPSALMKLDGLLAHQHEQLRLDDVQLAGQPRRRLLELSPPNLRQFVP